MRKDYMRLLDFAKDAMANAYAPYSGFVVGAAVLTADGMVFTGSNVENASYGLSICAERVAITKALSEGKKEFVAIAVVGRAGVTPCGACRQFIYEFGAGIDVIYLNDGKTVVKKISELLPEGFTLKRS
ncbi:MAG: cytidine deaminase [Thermoplasmata archaeon]|nr:cytidine deaminase [Thermoplasmata archaeon]